MRACAKCLCEIQDGEEAIEIDRDKGVVFHLECLPGLNPEPGEEEKGSPPSGLGGIEGLIGPVWEAVNKLIGMKIGREGCFDFEKLKGREVFLFADGAIDGTLAHVVEVCKDGLVLRNKAWGETGRRFVFLHEIRSVHWDATPEEIEKEKEGC